MEEGRPWKKHTGNHETLRGPHVDADFICEERRGTKRSCERRRGEERTDHHQLIFLSSIYTVPLYTRHFVIQSFTTRDIA